MVSLITMCLATMAISMASSQQIIDITMAGGDLPPMDIFDGSPDALLYVNYAETSTSPWDEVGRTDDISDSQNPNWPEKYRFTYAGGQAQKIKLDVYDADSPDSDDYMGYVEFTLGELINASGRVLDKRIIDGNPGGGRIIITGSVAK